MRPDSYAEINNFYTATVYEKGAEVIRMQRALLGPQAFRRGMDLYFERHDGQAVTCDDFVQAMQDASGVDLGQFRLWYSQAGTPALAVQGDYDAKAKTFTLEVAQSCPPTPGQPAKRPLHIPLAIGLVGRDGGDLPLHLDGDRTARSASDTSATLHVREAHESFRFTDVRERPVPSLLRGFSAPVSVDYAYDEADLVLLAAHDSDPVCRWDAAQRVFSRAIFAETGRAKAGEAFALSPALADVVRALFVEAYAACRVAGEYSCDPGQVARRSLKNVCLAYLTSRDDAASRALALSQFDGADNMTDAIAALAALNDTAGEARGIAMDRFESRWRGNPLVMDKWLALQATSCRPGTLERVRALLSHPAYDARNPNRIRSLIGAFGQSNLPAFHAADGAGYAFIADQVLAIDRSNPQVAARLVAAFNRWRRFDRPHGELQRAALERIAAAPTLSTDVAEIVAHNLAG